MKKIILLFALTLFSSVFSFARTYDGNEKIYLRPSAVSWWLDASAKVGMYFTDGTNGTFIEVKWLVDNEGGNIWSASVPAGNWTKVIVTRHSASPISWDNDWNKTGDIDIDATANYIQSFSENSTTATWQTLKAHYRSKTAGNWSALSTWRASFDTNWTYTWNSFDAHVIPNNNDLSVTIMEAHKVTADNTNTVSSLTIKSTGELTINPGKQLTITGTATNNGTIKLLSNGTDGTATLVGDVTGTAEVNQAVTNLPRTYYAGIPVAVTSTSGITNVATFSESTDAWSALSTDIAGTMTTAGQGYLIQVPVQDPEVTNISFTGALNTGDKTIALTATEGKKKYNFLGNPYPSYLDGQKVVDASTNVEKSIWYRTKGDEGNTYSFATYNVPTGTSIPATTAENNGFIPPMQGFWLKATAAGNFTFTNAMRTHNTTGTAIPLKAPQAAVNQILRVQVSNGTALDETVVLFNENATTNYDSYDASKMMNTGTGALNIYTIPGTENLVLNSMPAIAYDVEIPVGMKLAAGTYSVSIKEFSNFADGTIVLLIDKQTGAAIVLNNNNIYEFTITEAMDNADRFALVFPRFDIPTAAENGNAEQVYVFVRDNRIVVNAGENAKGTMIRVYNSVGQCINTQAVNGSVNEINGQFSPGVYLVKVNNVTAKVVMK